MKYLLIISLIVAYLFVSSPKVYANPRNAVSNDFSYSEMDRNDWGKARKPTKNVMNAHSMRRSKSINDFPFFGVALLIAASGYAWSKFKKN